MKKILLNLIFTLIFVLLIILIILSTIGIETKKFNNIINSKINETQKDVNITLETVKFKFDVTDLNIFLETLNPLINYKRVSIPVQNLKVYIDFFSLIKTSPKINKVSLVLSELEIDELKKLSVVIKPSNFRRLINNNITEGKVFSELNIFFDDNNSLQNFIAKGSVTNFQMKITDGILLQNSNFSFFSDKSDILIKNIFGEIDNVKIKEGDLKLNLGPEISLNSNFLTKINFQNKIEKNYIKLIEKFRFLTDLQFLDANLNNSLFVVFDETYKVKDYFFKSRGKINKAKLYFEEPLKNYFFKEGINELALQETDVNFGFKPSSSNFEFSGKHSINNKKFLSHKLKNKNFKEDSSLELEIEYGERVSFDIINYSKPKNSIAKISLNLEKKNNTVYLKKIEFLDGKNSIFIDNLELKKNKLQKFNNISIKTYSENKINNDFSVLNQEKILIKGSNFDATNLPKYFKTSNKENIFYYISGNIEIDMKDIKAPLSERLENFKLLGTIHKGNFTKINAKGDYGNKKFLDITMKHDNKNNSKYLEIFSDLPQPLLTQFSFFKGLSGGKLLFTSIIGTNNSTSKLVIENFKVINAPGMVKLLSLADLGGLADLAEGEGLSFDILEINMEKNPELLNLNEILATGPSISVLMDGYQDKSGVTSIRGTLVPAKNLNKLISKIPLLGEIIIPKEAGEGLFGVSFKMKGPPGKIKTTINPIRTLTPRFIQKILDKSKNSK
tara:strand:+ start:7697 stop:9886 length:2190 start_codon:yes stop_codon:yes gene_type:complete